MLDRRVTELTNHSQACSIRPGSTVIAQKYNESISDPAVVWGKECGLTKRLEIEPITSEDMENTPLESRMCFRTKFTSGVFSSKTLLSIW